MVVLLLYSGTCINEYAILAIKKDI